MVLLPNPTPTTNHPNPGWWSACGPIKGGGTHAAMKQKYVSTRGVAPSYPEIKSALIQIHAIE
jgi:hypothetical protein